MNLTRIPAPGETLYEKPDRVICQTVYAAPRTNRGPCDPSTCSRRCRCPEVCAMKREDARQRCETCGQAAGYDVPVVVVNGDFSQAIVHLSCAIAAQAVQAA